MASKARSLPSRVRSTSRASDWDRSRAVPAWRAGSIRLLGVKQQRLRDWHYVPAGRPVRTQAKKAGGGLDAAPQVSRPCESSLRRGRGLQLDRVEEHAVRSRGEIRLGDLHAG